MDCTRLPRHAGSEDNHLLCKKEGNLAHAAKERVTSVVFSNKIVPEVKNPTKNVRSGGGKIPICPKMKKIER